MTEKTAEMAWVRGDIVVPSAIVAAMDAHALAEYPSECCGFLSGPAATPSCIDAIQQEKNEADRYHALDPVRFPRDSRTYFKINELRAVRCFEVGAAQGQPVKVIYHSHCDAGAYFSEEDAATFAAAGQLMWPCAFVVLSVQQGHLADRKLWVYNTQSHAFAEKPLVVT